MVQAPYADAPGDLQSQCIPGVLAGQARILLYNARFHATIRAVMSSSGILFRRHAMADHLLAGQLPSWQYHRRLWHDRRISSPQMFPPFADAVIQPSSSAWEPSRRWRRRRCLWGMHREEEDRIAHREVWRVVPRCLGPGDRDETAARETLVQDERSVRCRTRRSRRKAYRVAAS